jgi:FMN reductase
MTSSAVSDVVVLVGNPRPGSRTRAVAEQAAALLAPRPAVLELAELTGVSYTADAVAATHPDESAVDRVRSASVLIVASPSYKGTYTGLLKLFLDRLPHAGLDGVVALPIAVAGSPEHAQATAADLGRLLGELGAQVPAPVALLESQLERPDFRGAVESVREAARSTG